MTFAAQAIIVRRFQLATCPFEETTPFKPVFATPNFYGSACAFRDVKKLQFRHLISAETKMSPKIEERKPRIPAAQID